MDTAVCQPNHNTDLDVGRIVRQGFSSQNSNNEEVVSSHTSSNTGTSLPRNNIPEPMEKEMVIEEGAALGQKRRAQLAVANEFESPARKKKKHSLISQMPRNAVCILNEMRPSLEYKLLSQEGPVHCPIFTMSVKVDGQEAVGHGRTKKHAKQAAAEAALRTFIQVPQMHLLLQGGPQGSIPMDFTSDSIEQFRSQNSEAATADGQESSPAMKVMPRQMLGVEKSPVMILNELRPGLKYECTSSSGEPYAKFTMAVYIDDKTFEGTGPSKKLAKTASARAALSTLYDYNFNMPVMPMNIDAQNNSQPPYTTLQSHQADIIARLVLAKYSELMEKDANHARRKVLAGIVMTRGELTNATVISVGTGTKCVGGDHLSVKGVSLNDSHAEIVARRGLCVFLYSQLLLHSNSETANDSIFIANADGKRFKLREEVKFHLYINTAPCGDARLVSHLLYRTLGVGTTTLEGLTR